MADIDQLSSPMDMVGRVRTLSEGKGAAATWEDIYYCFRLLLGRDPNAEEIPGHMAVAGRALPEVVAQFMNSAEFSARNLMASRHDKAELFELQGFRMYADPEDQAVGCNIPNGIYESHMTAFFRRVVQAGHSVVDVGANIGYFSLLASSIVGASGRVVAIEPSVPNCRLLEASRVENGFQQMQVHATAASAQSGIVSLHSVYSNGSIGGVSNNLATLMRSAIVEGVRLDDLLHLDALHLVKIDVEGHEHQALKGFVSHLERFRPIVVSEFTPGSMDDPGAYLNFLFALGYQIGIVHNEGVHYPEQDIGTLLDLQRATGLAHIDICASPEAII